MTDSKKQYGGDWVDKALAFRANAALQERNRIAKEEKYAADRHREKMQYIEKNKVDIEKKALEFAKKQQDLDVYVKEQCKEIHNLYVKVKKYDENSPVVTKFLAIRDFEMNIKTIDIGAVIDIAYLDRYGDTKDAIGDIKHSLFTAIGEHNSSLLLCYDEIIMYTNKIEEEKIHNYDENENLKNITAKIDTIVDAFPELSDITKCKDILRKCSIDFDNRVLSVKYADVILKTVYNDDSFRKLVVAFAFEKNIMGTVLDHDDFKNISLKEIEKNDFIPLYRFLEQCILEHKENYCSDAYLQKAIDYVATHAEQKSINVTENRLFQQHLACTQKIKELCRKYFNSLKEPSLTLYPAKQNTPGELIAETQTMFLVPSIKIFGDKLCIYTAFTRKEVSISFDAFIKNTPEKLKTTVFGKIEYDGLHIASSKQYYNFFIDLQTLLKEHYPVYSEQPIQHLETSTFAQNDISPEIHTLSKKTKAYYLYSVLYGVSIVWLILGVITIIFGLFQDKEFLKDGRIIANVILSFMLLFCSPYIIIRWLRNKYLNKRLR